MGENGDDQFPRALWELLVDAGENGCCRSSSLREGPSCGLRPDGENPSFSSLSFIPLLPYVSATSWAKQEFLFNCGKTHMKRNWPS